MSTEKMNSTAVYALFEEVKEIIQTAPKQAPAATPQLHLPKIDDLEESMKSGVSTTKELTEQLSLVIEEARKPMIRERKITIDIVAKETLFIFIGMVITIAVLGSALYFSTRPDYDRVDNDLKYRYIKMKGEASPARISELEDLFEINRDNNKIRQFRKDVEEYERLVKEQARRNASEAGKLNQEADKLKKK